MAFQIKRGTNSQRLGYTAASGELIYTTDTKILYVGDGTTPGGVTVGTVSSAGDFILNGLSGSVVLAAGTGLTLSVSGNTLTFANIGGACAGVNSVNGLSGAIVFASGSGMTLSVSGNTLTFATTGAPSGLSQYVESINGSTGVITNVAFTNIGQTFSGTQNFNGLIKSNGSILSYLSTTDPTGVSTSAIFGPRLTLLDGDYDYNGGLNFIRPYETISSINLSKGKKIVTISGSTGLFQAGFTSADSSIEIGYNNKPDTLSLTNSTIVGSKNFGPDLSAFNSVLLYGNNNGASLSVYTNNLIFGNTNLTAAVTAIDTITIGLNNFLNIPDSRTNIGIGNSVMGEFVGTAQNNIFIGNEVAKAVSDAYDYYGNVIIGQKAASNTTFGLTGSVIIGSAYLSGLQLSANVTRTPNANLGSYQLLVGTGRTAWITGNCSGFIGLAGIREPRYPLHVQGDVYAGGTYMYIANQFTPGSSAANGTTGAFAWDNDYIYVCIGTNSWRRAGLTSW
jgi:hypothetical protein